MKWETFARAFAGTAILSRVMIDSAAAGLDVKGTMAVQISRWGRSGQLVKLARGRYLLAPPWAPAPPPACVANQLVYPSYVSLAYALQFYDLIPEGVPVVTSVTTKRPGLWTNPAGRFRYRHVKRELFFGSTSVLVEGQFVSMATPEKALLDFFYFESGRFTKERFEEYRFQNLDRLELKTLKKFSARMANPKLAGIVKMIQKAVS